jgi:hypothetical protein
MEVRNQIGVDAPAARVWEALGEGFMRVGDWAAPVISSCALGPTTPAVGVTRCCSHAAVGPIKAGIVQERLTLFDREGMALEYEAVEGMPSFIVRAVNRWSVERVDDQRSMVRIHATLALRGPVRLFSWLVKWRLEAVGERVAEELKYFVEHGWPHPRKQAARGAADATAPSADGLPD